MSVTPISKVLSPLSSASQFSPGRFFAVAEIKATIAFILLNYDIKLDGGATKAPPGKWFAGQYMPDDKARLLFKSRSK